MDRYKASLQQNAPALRASYPQVCRALLHLDALRRRARAKHPDWAARPQPPSCPLIAKVAAGTRDLIIDTVPRLIVFGFDADQRDGAVAALRQRLTAEYGATVYAVGNPKGLKATPAFQPSREVLAAQTKIHGAEAATRECKRPRQPAETDLSTYHAMHKTREG